MVLCFCENRRVYKILCIQVGWVELSGRVLNCRSTGCRFRLPCRSFWIKAPVLKKKKGVHLNRSVYRILCIRP